MREREREREDEEEEERKKETEQRKGTNKFRGAFCSEILHFMSNSTPDDSRRFPSQTFLFIFGGPHRSFYLMVPFLLPNLEK